MPHDKPVTDFVPGDRFQPANSATWYRVLSATKVDWNGITLEIGGATVTLSPPRRVVVIVGLPESGSIRYAREHGWQDRLTIPARKANLCSGELIAEKKAGVS